MVLHVSHSTQGAKQKYMMPDSLACQNHTKTHCNTGLVHNLLSLEFRREKGKIRPLSGKTSPGAKGRIRGSEGIKQT